jgi:predicted HNH restriction endonuclease
MSDNINIQQIKMHCNEINNIEDKNEDDPLLSKPSLELFEEIFKIILNLEISIFDDAVLAIARNNKGYGLLKPYTHYKKLTRTIRDVEKLKRAQINLENISCDTPNAFFKDVDTLYKQNILSIKESIKSNVIEEKNTIDKPSKKDNLTIVDNELNNILPEEINLEESSKLIEGAKKYIVINVYERDSKARAKCIEYYGTKCFICKFDFEEVYGEVGKGFIHVHHLKPLSEIEDEYEVDPINDLIPVCPNCHAIFHKRRPSYSIEEIQNFISKHKTYNKYLDDE